MIKVFLSMQRTQCINVTNKMKEVKKGKLDPVASWVGHSGAVGSLVDLLCGRRICKMITISVGLMHMFVMTHE